MVIIVTPAGLERSFRALSRPAESLDLPPAPDGPPSPEQIAALMELNGELGVTFAPPR